ncbi:MAG: tRNA pseudouridine(38-40) synthase TruA [Verrucomicrobiota bacterium]
MTRRLQLTLAYDGRPFRGWQSQAGKDSVQDALEAAFARLNGGARVPVHGAGRTDAGVHALAQSAHADVPGGRFTPPQWLAALNAHLPPEIRVTRCRWVRPDFHARFAARGKRYVYRIWNGPVLPPLEIGRAWHVCQPLDLARLRAAAALLTGTHDFGGFAANRGVPCPDTVRTIRRIDVKGRTNGLLTLTFEGDGFLYKMVRLLTGSLVRVAQGKAEPEWLSGLLAPQEPGAPRVKTSFAAPAEGLYLSRVFY